MAVRISLEIGHEASIRTKKTPEGFTHDWEVFVRGCDGADISYYVEKVVFLLHDTFPKPRRVVKEPPYSVKESGYAGFNFPIEIYLRNSGEPKKLRFNYDLHLQQSGLPIQKTQKEKHVFNNPPDDFKARLLKGGGTISNSANSQELSDSRPSYDNEKNQMTSKPKLAGCDNKKHKFKPEASLNHAQNHFQKVFGSPIFTTSNKTVIDQNKLTSWKDQKNTQNKSEKVSSDKVRTHKDGSSHKDREKDKFKDSDKKREEKRKDKVKDRERSKDKSVKKERSPRPKSPSPRRSSPKRSSVTPSRLSPLPNKHSRDSSKHDKEKRDKSDEKKAKKEKRKEHKDVVKHVEDKNNDEHNKFRPEIKKEIPKIKIEAPPSPPPKNSDRKEKSKDKSSSTAKDSIKEEKSYSEKYKSKKKDKEKRPKKEERPHKQEKKESLHVKQEIISPKKEKEKVYLSNPVITNADDDSSSSSGSSSDSSTERRPPKEVVKAKEERNSKTKKEKGYQDGGIKCKRKSNLVEADEPPEKIHRDHGNFNNNSDGEEAPSRSVREEEDYISVLRDLQHKIMGLKDNSDLQKVVQLIAETGKYEVSAHTFDFDLCLLDRSTVQQLQEFFASES